jgi:hypothetical protein
MTAVPSLLTVALNTAGSSRLVPSPRISVPARLRGKGVTMLEPVRNEARGMPSSYPTGTRMNLVGNTATTNPEREARPRERGIIAVPNFILTK